MKNKIIAVGFVSALFSSAVFAGTATHKKVAKENIDDLNARTVFLEKQVQSLQNKVTTMEKSEKKLASNLDLGLLVEMYAHGPSVVTSPALGVRRSADNASDLMVNLSSVNEDLVLLKLRKKMDNYATENNIPIPERPIIALSGGLEGTTTYTPGYNGTRDFDINLSKAEIDVIGEAGSAATGGMIISYDDKKPARGVRVSNSRLKLDRGFLTIGQLNKFPLYLTIGQIYAPFGSYSTHMVTDPSTKTLGRTKDRMIVLGFSDYGINAQVYGSPGETKNASANNVLNHGGFNLGFDYAKDKFKLNIAGGIIGNIAESEGMQANVFGNKNNGGSETIYSRVCGIEGRIVAAYDVFSIFAEYVGAVKDFDSRDLIFNNSGAKPQAINIEGNVEFNVKGRPSNFSVGYGQTWQSLALNLPRNTFFAEYDISLVKNTILSIEYRHDINYSWSDSGKGNSKLPLVTAESLGGRHRNIISTNLAVYF